MVYVRERIRARRKELGLSAEAVAELVGVSPATIYRYESADILNMGIDKIEPIAKALKTTPAYIMGWDLSFDYSLDMNEKIRMLRKKYNLTLEEVGNFVGVGKSTVRKWENGDIANMRRDKIAKLAKVLNTTPVYLMGWDSELSNDESDILNAYRFASEKGRHMAMGILISNQE